MITELARSTPYVSAAESDVFMRQALGPIATGPELSLSWAGAEIYLPANTSPIWLAQFMRELVK